MALSSRAARPAMSFWVIDEKWWLYTAGRCRKQGTAAIAHGSEVRLTPRPFGMNSAAFDSYTKPMKTEIESRNARHTSRFGLGRNRSSLFPQAAPWFVNLDSVPCWACWLPRVRGQRSVALTPRALPRHFGAIMHPLAADICRAQSL